MTTPYCCIACNEIVEFVECIKFVSFIVFVNFVEFIKFIKTIVFLKSQVEYFFLLTTRIHCTVQHLDWVPWVIPVTRNKLINKHPLKCHHTMCQYLSTHLSVC